MAVREAPAAAAAHTHEMPARGHTQPPSQRRLSRPRSDAITSLLLAVLLCLPLMPFGRIFSGETWRLQAVLTIAVLIGVGVLMRALRTGGIGALIAQVAVGLGAATLLTAPAQAFLFVIPTFEVFGRWDVLAGDAAQQIRQGVAPMPEDPTLSFLLVSAIALITVLADLIVITFRASVAAILIPLALALAPSAILPHGSDAVAIALIVIVGAALLYRSVRLRGGLRPGGVLGAGVVSVVIALVAAIIVAPLLPRGGNGSLNGFGLGSANRIDATLDLGEDLRRPNNTRMLTFTTDGGAVPYLRLTTMSQFTGSVWEPDEGERVDLDWLAQFPEVRDPAVETTTHQISVEVDGVDSTMLPLPPEPFDLTGIGAGWRADSDNRTVASEGTVINGLSYGASYTTAAPSLEQIRAASAQIGASTGLSAEDAPLLHQYATEVTAEAATDYDKLVALQSWFRSSEFSYSLDAPVEDGYDGSSAVAIEAFLTQRSGYCVHFAAAFTLMARDLGMQARIALGFLPGEATGTSVDDRVQYAVSSDQLHTWPEVYFAGIGWVAFEPTASLGVATRFLSAAPTGSDPVEPSAPAPTSTATAQPERPDITEPTDTSTAGSGPSVDLGRYLAVLGWIALAVAVVLAPLVARTVLRARRMTAARGGDAAAAWAELRADAADHGLRPDDSNTPREFVDRIVTVTGAPREELDLLRAAIERVSYGREDAGGADGEALAGAVADVHRIWQETADPHVRRRARFLPVSLLPRRDAPTP